MPETIDDAEVRDHYSDAALCIGYVDAEGVKARLARVALHWLRECVRLEKEQAGTDWRVCPECGVNWPHPSVTSHLDCPPCRHAGLFRRLNGAESALRDVLHVLESPLPACDALDDAVEIVRRHLSRRDL